MLAHALLNELIKVFPILFRVKVCVGAMLGFITIIIMSLFNEDNIFSKYTYLTYGPLKRKNTNST